MTSGIPKHFPGDKRLFAFLSPLYLHGRTWPLPPAQGSGRGGGGTLRGHGEAHRHFAGVDVSPTAGAPSAGGTAGRTGGAAADPGAARQRAAEPPGRERPRPGPPRAQTGTRPGASTHAALGVACATRQKGPERLRHPPPPCTARPLGAEVPRPPSCAAAAGAPPQGCSSPLGLPVPGLGAGTLTVRSWDPARSVPCPRPTNSSTRPHARVPSIPRTVCLATRTASASPESGCPAPTPNPLPPCRKPGGEGPPRGGGEPEEG